MARQRRATDLADLGLLIVGMVLIVLVITWKSLMASVARIVGTQCVGGWTQAVDGTVIVGDGLVLLGVAVAGGGWLLRRRRVDGAHRATGQDRLWELWIGGGLLLVGVFLVLAIREIAGATGLGCVTGLL